MKIKSISIDEDVDKDIEAQAVKEGRNYSNMVEWMAKKYIEDQTESK